MAPYNSAEREAQYEAQRQSAGDAAKRDIGNQDINRVFADLLNPGDEKLVVTPGTNIPGFSVTDAGGKYTALPQFFKQFDTIDKINDRWAHDPNMAAQHVAHFKKYTDDYKPLDYKDSTLLEGLRQDYMNYATPEVKRKSEEANRNLGFQLARRGTLDSSVAADKSGEVERQMGEAMARITAQAQDLSTRRAGDIERARQGIVSQLEATGNTAEAANAAVAAAGNLNSAEEFKPLGQLFDVGLTTGKGVLDIQSSPYSSPTIFHRSNKGSSKTIK